MRAAPTDFPVYSRREAAADWLVHLIGVPTAIAAVAWMLATHLPSASPRAGWAAGVYCAGLIGMLSASAAYNLVRPGRSKAILRRIDHAMIFVMIAGSYTPFALCALPPRIGVPLLAAAWAIAVIGIALKLVLGNRHARAFVLLYLVHGWLLLPVAGSLVASLRPAVLALLVGGGIVYSLGALVHTRDRWPFHNAAWHAMVLLAAGLHLSAIAQVVAA